VRLIDRWSKLWPLVRWKVKPSSGCWCPASISSALPASTNDRGCGRLPLVTDRESPHCGRSRPWWERPLARHTLQLLPEPACRAHGQGVKTWYALSTSVTVLTSPGNAWERACHSRLSDEAIRSTPAVTASGGLFSLTEPESFLRHRLKILTARPLFSATPPSADLTRFPGGDHFAAERFLLPRASYAHRRYQLTHARSVGVEPQCDVLRPHHIHQQLKRSRFEDRRRLGRVSSRLIFHIGLVLSVRCRF
jgi:hypothetical protein